MRKILAVDDEEIMLKLIKRVLSDKYEVVTASSGREGIEAYLREKPDLVLSDLLMPEMSGFKMLDQLCEMVGGSVPVIFITSDEREETEERGFDRGAVDFLRKPFRPAALLRRVDNALGNISRIRSLKEEAATDDMTGLLNKTSITAQLTDICRLKTGTLMIIDIDNFKLVNDIYGHDAGDRVLSRFADILRHHIRQDNDIAGRIGGDEFLVFCSSTERKVVKGLAELLGDGIRAAADELIGRDMNIPLGVSIGAVFVTEHESDFAELFRRADKALYSVKQNGRHGYAIHSEHIDMHAISSDLHTLSMLFEERSVLDGAFCLGQEAFGSIYRFIMRYIHRYGKSACKLLFTLNPTKGTNETFFHNAVESFGEHISRQLRKSDIMVRIKEQQYFLLLPEINSGDIDRLVARLLKNWSDEPLSSEADITYEKEIIISQGSDYDQ